LDNVFLTFINNNKGGKINGKLGGAQEKGKKKAGKILRAWKYALVRRDTLFC